MIHNTNARRRFLRVVLSMVAMSVLIGGPSQADSRGPLPVILTSGASDFDRVPEQLRPEIAAHELNTDSLRRAAVRGDTQYFAATNVDNEVCVVVVSGATVADHAAASACAPVDDFNTGGLWLMFQAMGRTAAAVLVPDGYQLTGSGLETSPASNLIVMSASDVSHTMRFGKAGAADIVINMPAMDVQG